MNSSDRKILSRALAGISHSRKASLESVLLEDSDPGSKDQNKPESYYDLEPRGVQGTQKSRRASRKWGPMMVSEGGVHLAAAVENGTVWISCSKNEFEFGAEDPSVDAFTSELILLMRRLRENLNLSRV